MIIWKSPLIAWRQPFSIRSLSSTARSFRLPNRYPSFQVGSQARESSRHGAHSSKLKPSSGVRLHGLRHVHASLMLRQGVHPKIVQERLGHSSINTTLDTYSHVRPGLQEAAAEQFEEILKGVEVGEEERVGKV